MFEWLLLSHSDFVSFLQNIDHLREIEVVKQLGNILKTNVRGCKSVGHPFVTQLGRIYLDMLNVYRCLSENISVAIAENGEIVTKQPLIRAMRTVKTETLRLISTWVSKSNDAKLVCDNFIPPLLDAVLGDYQRNVPNAREPEVLNTMATFVNKLEVCIDLFLLLFFYPARRVAVLNAQQAFGLKWSFGDSLFPLQRLLSSNRK